MLAVAARVDLDPIFKTFVSGYKQRRSVGDAKLLKVIDKFRAGERR